MPTRPARSMVRNGAALLSDPRLYIDLGDDGAPAPVELKS